MLAWLPSEGAKRRAALAAAVYGVTTLVYVLFAARETLTEHTPYNHFALQAEAWLHGRTDLGGPNAHLAPEESAHPCADLILGLTLARTGKFLHYSGSEIAF